MIISDCLKFLRHSIKQKIGRGSTIVYAASSSVPFCFPPATLIPTGNKQYHARKYSISWNLQAEQEGRAIAGFIEDATVRSTMAILVPLLPRSLPFLWSYGIPVRNRPLYSQRSSTVLLPY